MRRWMDENVHRTANKSTFCSFSFLLCSRVRVCANPYGRPDDDGIDDTNPIRNKRGKTKMKKNETFARTKCATISTKTDFSPVEFTSNRNVRRIFFVFFIAFVDTIKKIYDSIDRAKCSHLGSTIFTNFKDTVRWASGVSKPTADGRLRYQITNPTEFYYLRIST